MIYESVYAQTVILLLLIDLFFLHRYNDHHFHYGYMITAAAVVAKHRPEWAREYYERVLLYIRDIANPSLDDEFFPMYRQKDW